MLQKDMTWQGWCWLDLRLKDKRYLRATPNRNCLTREMKLSMDEYRKVKKDIRHHEVLVQWLLALSPQIEADEKQRKIAEIKKQHKAAKGYSEATRSRKKRRCPN